MVNNFVIKILYINHNYTHNSKNYDERGLEDFRKGKRKLSEKKRGELSPIWKKFWINNGIVSKYWDDEKTIPDGWRKGRIVNWSTAKQL